MSEPRVLQYIFKTNDKTFHVEFENLIEDRKNEKVTSILKTVFTCVPVLCIVDTNGTTLLHLAAEHNNLELIDFLVSSGCDVNAKDSFGATPFLTAFFANHSEAVDSLLNANTDLSMKDAERVLRALITKKNFLSETTIAALMQRLRKCNEDLETLTVLLVKVGCPMKYVIYMGDARLTQTMLEISDHKINVIEAKAALKHVMEIADFENLRVLWQCNRIDRSRKLLLVEIHNWVPHIGMPIEWGFFRPAFKQLHKWIIFNDEFIKFLWDTFQLTSKSVLQVLLQECNVDVQLRQKYQFDVLPILFNNRDIDDEDVIELAFKRKFNVNDKSYEGRTALHFAVYYSLRDKVQLLLEWGADCNIKDDFGSTPFNLIHDDECCKLILQSGAHLRIGENYEFEIIAQVRNSTDEHASMWKILLAQLAIESYQGVRIKQEIVDTINTYSPCKDYYENCLQQVKDSMNREILPSLTLFSILTKKTEKLVLHIQSKATVSMIMDRCSQQSLHSFYRSSLQLKSEKAYNVFRSKCRAAAIISKSTSVPINFDSLIVDKIFELLSYRDMLMLASA